MKLTVFGATGGIGKILWAQAILAGHEVTAVARRPEAITFTHNRLRVLRGDVLDPSTLAAAIEGQDAVISAIGTTERGPTTLYSQGVGNIIRAMDDARMRRLLVVSADGLEAGPEVPFVRRLLTRYVVQRMFADSYADLRIMEQLVRASDLEWTIVRPPRLTNGPLTGRYQVGVDTVLKRAWQISRADVADYLLRHIDDPVSLCAQVEIAN
jgi:putative NADH-flavin reductase